MVEWFMVFLEMILNKWWSNVEELQWMYYNVIITITIIIQLKKSYDYSWGNHDRFLR